MQCWASFLQERTVVPIHRQKQIKLFKVTFNNRSRPQVGQVITSFERMRLAAFIGWRIGMEVVRSC